MPQPPSRAPHSGVAVTFRLHTQHSPWVFNDLCAAVLKDADWVSGKGGPVKARVELYLWVGASRDDGCAVQATGLWPSTGSGHRFKVPDDGAHPW